MNKCYITSLVCDRIWTSPMTEAAERDALFNDDVDGLWNIDACIDWYDFDQDKELFACSRLDKCYSGYFEWFKEKNGNYPSPSEKSLNTILLENAYIHDTSILS